LPVGENHFRQKGSTSQHAGQHDCRFILRKMTEPAMFGLGEIGEAFAEFEGCETSPWDTRGIPDNETLLLVRTTVKRNTVYRTMKHLLGHSYRTMKHLFRSQLPETTGDFYPPNLLFKVINNNTGRLLFNVESA
jgi:hypothetical protein